MVFPPLHMLALWRRGLLAAGALGAGACLLGYWHGRRRAADRPASAQRGAHPALLVGGLALGAWSLGGGWLADRLAWRHCPRDWPGRPEGGTARRLRRPDGSELQVVEYGPADGEPVVLTHGWGADHNEWAYTWRDLVGRYRLITWDLAGLGESTPPRDGDWSMERVARDLDAVLALAGDRGAVLVGHSLGAMALLTYCRLFPKSLGTRVRGLVLAHVTYTNPARTTAAPELTTALQKPLFEPVCHATAAAPSVVRVLAVLCYLSGMAHHSLGAALYSGNESWEQRDFVARYYLEASPTATAQYTLSMFRFDETATLGAIRVPTLIVVGDQDQNCVPAAQYFMARVMPDARVLTLRPARHGGILEHYEEFDRALAEFVGACSTDREHDRIPPSKLPEIR